jgi:type IV secretory pathway protease TraF
MLFYKGFLFRYALVTTYYTYPEPTSNSLDSRYYGPVREANITGVYSPVWVSDD